MTAIEALPEFWRYIRHGSEHNQRVYHTALDKCLAEHGWTYEEYDSALVGMLTAVSGTELLN